MTDAVPENIDARILMARYEEQAREIERLKGGDGGGISGGVTDDWKSSVDAQLRQLHQDVRNLLFGGLAAIVVLLGAGWAAFSTTNTRIDNLGAQVSDVRVSQARADAKLDLLIERTAPTKR